MLKRCTLNTAPIEFYPKNSRKSSSNIFSIIVGKNGTGKSRLLKSIIENALSLKNSFYRFEREERYEIRASQMLDFEFDFLPNKIIALSTSPFDRFPIPRRMDRLHFSNDYIYLGLRDVLSHNLSLGYMSKIINSLIYSINKNNKKADGIARILDYLGYSDIIEARFALSISQIRLNTFKESHNPELEMLSYINSNENGQINRSYFIDDDGKADYGGLNKLFNLLDRLTYFTKKPRLELSITRNGILINGTEGYINDEDVLYLIHSGVARLRDITIQKKESGLKLKINEASSGEQSVVMSMLGIASQIDDNCLICIDEPEICLHPEWQGKYISLLISTFNQFNNCHFIIATHSPQIISNLEENNCYVTSMDDGYAMESRDIINKSIDFQLANIFKSPGHRNEYLSRELISILTQFGHTGSLTIEQHKLANKILELQNKIDESDPVYKLMSILKESIGDSL